MRALILNSGLGTRLNELTANTCKCLIEIADGISILDMQVQSLFACGIQDICITTGAFADKLERYIKTKYPHGNFTFINNPIYDKTNYIYSIYLAQAHLRQDILLLHGDLVFETCILQDLINAKTSVLVIDSTKPLPDKDFKAKIKEGFVTQIGINIFSDAYHTQPMYKLLKKDWLIWLQEINRFCEENRTGVYAEDAFNCVSRFMELYPLDILGRDCFEVDNKADLAQAKQFYLKTSQRLYTGYGSRDSIKEIINASNAKKPMVICAKRYNGIASITGAVYFNGYTANPKHEEVLNGIALFKREKCDFLVSVGGGSAMDIAKGINILTEDTDPSLNEAPRCRHLAVPTTAGSGSEATCFAVLYKNGVKFSITHHRLSPEYVILDPAFLETLPLYQKKSAMLDALCQSIESLWAKGATAKSRKHAEESIRIIEENEDAYLAGEGKESTAGMLMAAHLSGKAINISKTTAAHAMSYGLTTRFGIAHGHAVSLCLPLVWEHLLKHKMTPEILSWEKYTDFIVRLAKLEMAHDFSCDEETARELADTVDIERLNNHPVPISKDELEYMYRTVLLQAKLPE